MSLPAINQLVHDDLQALDECINRELGSSIPLIQELSKYIIHSGGKRLRPITIMLSAKAMGYLGNEHIRLAAAMEFFHCATLLHDDVVDESQLRRGKKTANTIWGSKASVLVGDYLFTLAFQNLVSVKNFRINQVLADTANDITKGEVLQLLNSHNPETTQEQYLEVIKYKTAVLFSCAAQMGPLLVGCDENVISAMVAFGLHLGNAFQIVDDALDYCGDVNVIGKNIGDDLADGKITLPLIHALKNGSDEQQKLIREAIKKGDISHFGEVVEAIATTDAFAYSKSIAAQEIDRALSALSQIPPSLYRDALADLANFALQRTH